MKAILLSLFCCALCTTAMSTIHVVDNNINNTSAFESLQEAIDFANEGDTIYIQPSNVFYDSPQLSKKLIFFGAGRNPNKQNSVRSKIINFTVQLGADGSQFHGLFFSNSLNVSQNGVDNITITSCYINSLTIRGDNYFIENCILGEQNGSSSAIIINTNIIGEYENIVVQNSVISAKIQNMDGSGNALRNNLFLPNIYWPAAFHANDPGQFVIVENNIFYGQSPANCLNCTFNNNITYQTTQDLLPYGNNTGVDNLTWFENEFVDAGLPTFDFLGDLYQSDVHLETGASGTGAGTDGNDIGLYGGSNPYSHYGEPELPVVRNFYLQNASVPINGTLEISITSSAPE